MAMAEKTREFCETHSCRALLFERANRLRAKADELEALADAIPQVFPTIEAENAMRSLILNQEVKP